MSHKLSVRLAKKQDFQGVLEASEGVFDGRDYLPFVFHQWLKMPGKYMFVAELNGKIIGFEAATVIDGGQTIYCHALRINQEYRGRRYSYHIFEEVLRQVKHLAKEALKVRFIVAEDNLTMKHSSQRLGYKAFMRKRFHDFEIPKGKVADLKSLYGDRSELHKLNVIDAAEFVLAQRKFDHIIPNKILEVLNDPYELVPANADLVFEEDDEIIRDLTANQLRQGISPRSLSHGRLRHKVELQSWICSIYAHERDVFKEHLMQQLMAAVEQLERTGRKTCLEVLHSPVLAFDEKVVFKEVLGLEEGFTDRVLSFEKTFKSKL